MRFHHVIVLVAWPLRCGDFDLEVLLDARRRTEILARAVLHNVMSDL